MSHFNSRARLASDELDRVENRVALIRSSLANWITLAIVGLLSLGCAVAGELEVSVIDRSGHGVAETVVTIEPINAPHPASAPATAVMDQKNLAFVPRVLVIASGTKVEFPNNDSVSHQVYSFSAAKRFQLPLYKGQVHPPVIFDKSGLVVLGCNIHDQMAGYIYVTDAPFFGMTDATGTLKVSNLQAGDYRITVWSPLIADPPATLARIEHVAAADGQRSRFQLAQELRARPEPRPRRSDWEY
jgi:plastocyanin